MKRKGKVISVFVILFCSFLLVFLIPLCMNIIFYSNTYRIIEQFLYKYNTFLINQLESKVYEEIIKPIETIKKLTNANPFYVDFILPPENISKEDIYLDYKVFSRELNTYLSNPFIEDVCVYIPVNDKIVSASFFESSKLYYDFVCTPVNYTYKSWNSFLSKYYSDTFISSWKVNMNRRTRDTILFIHTLENWSFGSKKANLLIYLNEERLTNFLKDLLLDKKGSIYILDERDKTILGYSTEQRLTNYFLKLTKEGYSNEGFKNIRVEKENYIMYYSVSSVNNWKYFYLIPSNEFLHYLKKVRFSILSGLLLSIVIGGLLIYYLSIQNYKPIGEIKNAFLSHSFSRLSYDEYIKKAEGKSEYSLLKSLTSAMLDQGAYLKKQLLHLENIMNNMFLVHLLKGEIEDYSSVNKYINVSNGEFSSNSFAVVLIEIEEFFKIKDKTVDEDLTQFIIFNVLTELFKKAGYMVFNVVFSKNQLGLILNLPKDITTEMRIKELLDEGKNYLQGNFSIFFTAGISKIRDELTSLHKCYREANEALKLKFIFGSVAIYTFDKVSNSLKEDLLFYFPHNIENAIINCVMSGDIEKTKEIINKLYEQNLETNSLPLPMLKLFTNQLFNIYTKILLTVKHSTKENMEEITQLFDFQSSDKIEDIKNVLMLLKERLLKLTESVDLINSAFSSKLIKKILKFVEDNYTDPNISLALIAEKFNITPQYLSALFKEKIGVNLSDYIMQLRIIKAKEFLINTKDSINKISQEIGYTHVSSFIKVFKKSEGVSPTQYRMIHEKNNTETMQ